jgi:hypothetical protein
METIKYELTLPEGYEKKELLYFNEWIAALESGEYKQGTGVLCRGTGEELKYCCLGILSKIQGRLISSPDHNGVYYDDAGLREACGLAKDNPNFPYIYGLGKFPEDVTVLVQLGDGGLYERAKTLSFCNDQKVSFKEIAEIIKQVWKPNSTN